jgi:hypothetical protein
MLEAAKLDQRSSYILTDLRSILTSFEDAEKSQAKGFEQIKDIAAKAADLRKKIISGV